MLMQTYKFVYLRDFCLEFELDCDEVYDMISDSDSVSFGDAYDTLICVDQLLDIFARFDSVSGEKIEEIEKALGKKNANLLISLGS